MEGILFVLTIDDEDEILVVPCTTQAIAERELIAYVHTNWAQFLGEAVIPEDSDLAISELFAETGETWCISDCELVTQ